ncbi:HepT-like ribonuclease domain-containing protein [Caproiciproducens faecalis]|nr:HepT-like ribonuclease domain-containing protein [Caproiciproducens faecalis]
MQNNSRNADILKHIISYCDQIEDTVQRFGKEYDIFEGDPVYKNATALCVLQIGELTKHLTDDFKQSYNQVPWVQIKALRNIVAHNYGKIDSQSLWETITEDIPLLKAYCSKIIDQFDILMQESKPHLDEDEEQDMELL